jgi:hypothetical protein
MNRSRFFLLKGLKFMLFAVVITFVLGSATMLLWNWLMPALFGLAHISFWQAIGILVLSKLLFGGFGSRHGGPWRHHDKRQHWQARWEKMTPEEREKCKSKMKHHWGTFPWEKAENEASKEGVD